MEEYSIENELVKLGEPFRESYNYYKVLCPSHKDTDPSLCIYKNGWCYCFSCNYSVPFSTYLKDKGASSDSYKRIVYTRKKNATRLTLRYPNGFTLLEGEIPELKMSKDVVEEFNIGYCKYGFKDKTISSCKDCYFYDKEKKEKRWINDKGYCFFASNRIMVPIVKDQRLYSIESRDLSGKSKKKVIYPNNSKVSLTIFNYNNLSREKPLYVVEGIKGALRFWRDINKNVTAIFSNRLKGEQWELLKEFNHIVLIPDLGESGDVTLSDFVKLGIEKLEVVRLPYLVICKDCSHTFTGVEKKDRCSKCDSTRVSYCDVFDYKTETLRRIIRGKKSVTSDYIEKLGVKDKENIKIER